VWPSSPATAGHARLTRRRYALLAGSAAVLLAVILVFGETDEVLEQTTALERPVKTDNELEFQWEHGTGVLVPEQDKNSTLLVSELARGLPTEGCESRIPPEAERRTEDEYMAMMDQAGVTLSKTSEPDSLVAAALLTRDATQRQRLLERALGFSPGHRVAAWDQILNCQTTDCDRDTIEATALAADGTNGMVWFVIASDRIKSGRWADAEMAMRQLAAATRYSLYFMEYATLIERGLAATTDLGYSERIMAGIGIAAAIGIPALGDVSRACQSGENDAVVWIELCREVGKRMSAEGEDLIVAMFGYGLRSTAVERAGDAIEAKRIKKEGNDRFNSLINDQARAGAQVLLMNDPQVLQAYVENYLAHGEHKAAEELLADARRLRADPTYDQCNFVGNTDAT